jgi:uncharacterized protein DUF2568
VPAESAAQAGPLQAAVFLAELALLAALGVAGARLAGGAPASIALAVAFPLLAGVLWGCGSPRARTGASASGTLRA